MKQFSRLCGAAAWVVGAAACAGGDQAGTGWTQTSGFGSTATASGMGSAGNPSTGGSGSGTNPSSTGGGSGNTQSGSGASTGGGSTSSGGTASSASGNTNDGGGSSSATASSTSNRSTGQSTSSTGTSSTSTASTSTASTSSTGKDAGGGDGGAASAACSAAGVQVITVAADGSGQFSTVQSAVNSIAAGTTPVRIDLKPGTYTENLTISRQNITLCGQDPMTTVITYTVSGSSEATATRVSGNGFAAVNVTFENSSALGSGQAVALLASGTQQQFYNCRFVSYQDTLYTKSGSQYFKNCYVQGNTDYVFGAATAVLDNCSIYTISGGTAVTAPNTAASTTYGIVFLGGSLTAASTVSAGSQALGRPWGAAGSTTYLNTTLGAHISTVGWVAFNTNTVAGARFAEYKTTGPGAHPTQRAAGSSQLTDTQAAQYTIANIFGGWVPTFSQ